MECNRCAKPQTPRFLDPENRNPDSANAIFPEKGRQHGPSTLL
jgi:hypothetical protein